MLRQFAPAEPSRRGRRGRPKSGPGPGSGNQLCPKCGTWLQGRPKKGICRVLQQRPDPIQIRLTQDCRTLGIGKPDCPHVFLISKPTQRIAELQHQLKVERRRSGRFSPIRREEATSDEDTSDEDTRNTSVELRAEVARLKVEVARLMEANERSTGLPSVNRHINLSRGSSLNSLNHFGDDDIYRDDTYRDDTYGDDTFKLDEGLLAAHNDKNVSIGSGSILAEMGTIMRDMSELPVINQQEVIKDLKHIIETDRTALKQIGQTPELNFRF